MFKSSLALLLPLALAACTTGNTTPPSEPAPRPPQVGQGAPAQPGPDACGAERVQTWVGRAYDEARHEEIATTSEARQVRVMRPGEAHTMDYLHDRLNIRLDAQARITDLFCG